MRYSTPASGEAFTSTAAPSAVVIANSPDSIFFGRLWKANLRTLPGITLQSTISLNLWEENSSSLPLNDASAVLSADTTVLNTGMDLIRVVSTVPLTSLEATAAANFAEVTTMSPLGCFSTSAGTPAGRSSTLFTVSGFTGMTLTSSGLMGGSSGFTFLTTMLPSIFAPSPFSRLLLRISVMPSSMMSVPSIFALPRTGSPVLSIVSGAIRRVLPFSTISVAVSLSLSSSEYSCDSEWRKVILLPFLKMISSNWKVLALVVPLTLSNIRREVPTTELG